MGWYFNWMLEQARRPGRPGDAVAARELRNHIKNSEPLYLRYSYIATRLNRKVQLGTYDPRRAPQAFAGLCRDAAKDYCRTYANASEWSMVFAPIVRYIAAQLLMEDYRAEFAPAWILPGSRSGLCRLAEEGGEDE